MNIISGCNCEKQRQLKEFDTVAISEWVKKDSLQLSKNNRPIIQKKSCISYMIYKTGDDAIFKEDGDGD